jgi:hypothetical protein
VAFLQDLEQGADEQSGRPATIDELRAWTDHFALPFWAVVDPRDKILQYVSQTGIPYSMLIDPSTMKILTTFNGWAGEQYLKDQIERNM